MNQESEFHGLIGYDITIGISDYRLIVDRLRRLRLR
jgi:hypothetical protein